MPTDSSNATLGAAKDEFTDHKGINKQGSKLLNTLHKQERNDRWAGLRTVGPQPQGMHVLPCRPALPRISPLGCLSLALTCTCGSFCRRLLWAGLLLFLAACSYIGYKRAPLVVRAPLDMALGTAAGSIAGLWRKVGPYGHTGENVGPAVAL